MFGFFVSGRWTVFRIKENIKVVNTWPATKSGYVHMNGDLLFLNDVNGRVATRYWLRVNKYQVA